MAAPVQSSQVGFAVSDRIGVNETTITNLERNAAVPAIRYVTAIIEFLGYDPHPAASSLSERLVTARRGLWLSQRRMAEKLGNDPATLQDWEAGRHQPTAKSMELVAGVLPNRELW
jgi:transcriptional regulator with XRE-family HTH domain